MVEVRELIDVSRWVDDSSHGGRATSSEAPRYGGAGIVNPCREEGWKLPGESAVLFSVERPSEKAS